MAEDRAVISAEVEGASEVIADAKKISNAFKQAEKDGAGVGRGATAGVQGLGSRVDDLASKISPRAILGGVIGGFMATGINQVMGMVSGAADKAQAFGDTTAKTARRAGVDLGSLRATLKGNETATLQGAHAQSDFVAALAKTTYNGKGAMASLRSVGFAATASGRDLAEMIPVVASLQTGLNIKGNVGDELKRIGDLAQRLKTIGGPQALQDGIARLGAALEQVNVATAGARANLVSFFAVLSQNRKPGAAQATMAGAINMIQSRSLDIERTLGRRVLNDANEVVNPIGVLEDLQKHLRKRYPNNPAAQRRAAQAEWPGGVGTMIYATDFSKVHAEGDDRVMDQNLERSFGVQRRQEDPNEAEVQRLTHTPEGRRQLRGLRSEATERDVGETALGARERVYNMVDDVVRGKPAAAPAAPAPVVNGGGLTRADFTDLAKEIGRELRAAPPQIVIPPDPNRPQWQ